MLVSAISFAASLDTFSENSRMTVAAEPFSFLALVLVNLLSNPQSLCALRATQAFCIQPHASYINLGMVHDRQNSGLTCHH